MPIEFIELVKGFHPPSAEDRGFLINLGNRARWNNSATTEAMNLLRTFADSYFKIKCPDESEDKETDSTTETSTTDVKPDNSNGNHKGAAKKSYCIQFANRQITNNNIYCFIASNLADPEDFTHHIFSQLASDKKIPAPKLAFRILPVQRICEASPKQVEQTLLSLLELSLGKDSHPHRFSLIHRSQMDSVNLPYRETMNIARNCVWATNPNCVQCLKYQDYAVTMEVVGHMFYVGVVRDFQKFANYNTWIIHQKGLDQKEEEPDSEDDISDDPTLNEEEEKLRKLRIKRKRRAEKLAQEKGQAEKKAKTTDEQPESSQTLQGDPEDNDEVEEGDDDNNDNLMDALNGSRDGGDDY